MSQASSSVYTTVEENIGEWFRGRGVGERGGRVREELGEERRRGAGGHTGQGVDDTSSMFGQRGHHL